MNADATVLLAGALLVAVALAFAALWRRALRIQQERERERESSFLAEAGRAAEANRQLAEVRAEASSLRESLAAAEAKSGSLDEALAQARATHAAQQNSLEAARTDLARERAARTDRDAELYRLRALAEDRHRLFAELAAREAEIASYRQILADVETHTPPPILGGAHDDLKLIVGVGPVLERLLHKMGVTTFRQIASWSPADIDEFDVRLEEFHGRVRRDDWMTQARELHYQKYGERIGQA
jgi:predicted flap endonuclease-1-like 5' DNA nuclease